MSRRRPSSAATRTRLAISAARSTLGSALTRTTNHQTVTSDAPHPTRRPSPISRHAPSTPPTTIATFEPDTATRWDNPAASTASASAAGWPRTSPVTNPVSRLARASSRAADATVRNRSRSHVVAASHPGGVPVPCRSTTRTSTAAPCRANHAAASPSIGEANPDTLVGVPIGGVGAPLRSTTRSRLPTGGSPGTERVRSWASAHHPPNAPGCGSPAMTTSSSTAMAEAAPVGSPVTRSASVPSTIDTARLAPPMPATSAVITAATIVQRIRRAAPSRAACLGVDCPRVDPDTTSATTSPTTNTTASPAATHVSESDPNPTQLPTSAPTQAAAATTAAVGPVTRPPGTRGRRNAPGRCPTPPAAARRR